MEGVVTHKLRSKQKERGNDVVILYYILRNIALLVQSRETRHPKIMK